MLYVAIVDVTKIRVDTETSTGPHIQLKKLSQFRRSLKKIRYTLVWEILTYHGF